MSEPVSSLDVEDVLSSIRRLVSEEAKGNAEADDNALSSIDENIHEAAEEAARDALADVARKVMSDEVELEDDPDDDAFSSMDPPSNEFAPERSDRPNVAQKLVLTEALRVSDEEKREQIQEEEPTSRAANASEAPEKLDRLDSNVRPLRPSKFETSPEDSLFERAKEAMDEVAVHHARPQRRVNFVKTEPDMLDEGASALRNEMAETESRDQTADLGDDHTPEARVESPEVQAESAPSEPAENDPSPFAETAAGMAEQVGDQVEDAEILEEIAPEPSDEVEAEDEGSTINFAEEDSILDEETLRDLVSELVRSELQGELGDRITRNVRKLVRREIQRALTTREFE